MSVCLHRHAQHQYYSSFSVIQCTLESEYYVALVFHISRNKSGEPHFLLGILGEQTTIKKYSVVGLVIPPCCGLRFGCVVDRLNVVQTASILPIPTHAHLILQISSDDKIDHHHGHIIIATPPILAIIPQYGAVHPTIPAAPPRREIAIWMFTVALNIRPS